MEKISRRSWKLQDFMAHGSNVNCLSLGHKSGRVLVTGGDDKKVNLWAIGKEGCIISLSGHITPVECVRFSHTEDTVCAGSQAGIIKFWDLVAAKLLKTLTGHKSSIKTVDFHPYSDLLASGSLDSCIKLWDVRHKDCIYTFRDHRQTVNSVKFSPDGQWIASGGEDGTVKIFDIRVCRILKEFNQHKGPVMDVEFHPQDFLLASSSADGSVHFWDLEKFHSVSKVDNSSSVARCLYFSPRGECLLGGCSEQLKVCGWEPGRVYDTVKVNWGKVQDMAVVQDQLIGASFYLTNVVISVIDLKKVIPFGSPPSTSPFVHGQATRKSFSKKPPVERKTKLEVKSIEECEAELDDDTSAVIPNINNYEAVFRPNRSLNRSPPHSNPFSAPSSDDDKSLGSSTSQELNENGRKFRNPPLKRNLSIETVSQPVAQIQRSKSFVRDVKQQTQQSKVQRSANETSLPDVAVTQHSKNSNNHIFSAQIRTTINESQDVIQSHVNRSSPMPDVTTHSADVDFVPITCSSPVGLEMGDFLPMSYQHSLKYQQNVTGTKVPDISENEALSALPRGHQPMMAVLKNRQQSLQIVYSLWRNKDLKCAMEGAMSMNDLSVIVDILNAINLKPSFWNLDICTVLLPAIHDLLKSKYETYMTVASNALSLILRNFSSVIRMNVKWSSPTIGVDISKEERYSKCIKCYNTLVSIRTFLLKKQTVQGKLGQVFRELHTMLQAIDS